jgi:hypothetical protein
MTSPDNWLRNGTPERRAIETPWSDGSSSAELAVPGVHRDGPAAGFDPRGDGARWDEQRQAQLRFLRRQLSLPVLMAPATPWLCHSGW